MRVFIVCVCCTFSIDAADWYVRKGASGAANGANWTDAYDELSSAETAAARGDTIYVADGSYTSSVTFNTANSGTTLITIKKATVASHGTSTGWLDSYGDGQADWPASATLSFASSWWVMDGATRNESDWQSQTNYGFRHRITTLGQHGLDFEAGVSNITIKYFDIGDNTGTTWGAGVSAATGLYMAGSSSPQRVSLTFHRCHIHNVDLPIHSRSTATNTVEYCFIGPSFGKEAISHQTGHGWIVRYNKFVDNVAQPASEGGTAQIGVFNYTGGGDPADTLSDGWELYGNVFAGTGTRTQEHADAVILGSTVNNWKFYHNVISHTDGNWCGAVKIWGAGNAITNNLWYWMGAYHDANQNGGIIQSTTNSSGVAGGSHAWCYYKGVYANGPRLNAGCNVLPGTVITGSEDPFQSESTFDYRIKSTAFSGNSPIGQAVNLGNPYNIDANGVQHTNIGAYATAGASGSPTITLSATDNTATEAGTTTGTFTFTASSSFTGDVNYVIGGTAVNGSDYTTITSPLAMNGTSATLTITPIDDSGSEVVETVVITLSSGSGYVTGAPDSDTVNITSDDAGRKGHQIIRRGGGGGPF